MYEPLSHEVTHSSDMFAQSSGNPKWLEVMLYGPGCKEHIQARIGRNFSRKTVSVDHTSYFYPVNCSVKSGQEYTAYLPKYF
jgi:hypothetical protein